MMNLLKLLFSFLFFAGYAHSVTQEELQKYEIQRDDFTIVDILFKYGDSDTNPILNRAMEEKDYFAVFTLIEYGVNINSRSGHPPYSLYGKTVLELAIEVGEIPLVEYFLLKGADPAKSCKFPRDYKSEYISTAVYDAILWNRLDVFILFAKYNIDLNNVCLECISNSYYGNKRTPLQVAISSGKKDIVNFLLDLGVKI